MMRWGLLLAALLPGFVAGASISAALGVADGMGLAGSAVVLAYGLAGMLVAVVLSVLAGRWLPRQIVSALLFMLLGITLMLALMLYLRLTHDINRQGLFGSTQQLSSPVTGAADQTMPPPSPASEAVAKSEPVSSLHTDPSCWSQPRNYHQPIAGTEWAERTRLFSGARSQPEQAGVWAPNQAYRFWVSKLPGKDLTEVLIDHEHDGMLILQLVEPAGSPEVRWVNEKLLFVRVAWGRVLFSDMLLDVEQAQLIYHELLQDGSIAFQQYQQACSGPDAADCQCVDGFNKVLEPPVSALNENSMLGLLALPGILTDKDTDQPDGTLPAYLKINGDYQRITDSLDAGILETREYAYQQPGAVVYQRDRDWYAVRTLPAGRELWIQAQAGFNFHPVAELLPQRLNYLNEHWDGWLWSEPGGSQARQRTIPEWQQKPHETPVVIESTRILDGRLWLKVGFYSGPICAGPEPAVENVGWVPAYATSGHLVAWFFSRGC